MYYTYVTMDKLSTSQVAKRLGVLRPSLQRGIDEGRIPAPLLRKIGGIEMRLWDEADIARARVAEALAAGITHVEIKSGYALDVAGEERLCALAAELTDDVTFLGAHVVPSEYDGRADDYVSLVCGAIFAFSCTVLAVRPLTLSPPIAGTGSVWKLASSAWTA